MNFPEIALKVPRILLPRPDIDLHRWAVIACDQHTARPEYWQKVAEFVGESPSTLNLIFPEVYLEGPDSGDRVARINESMRRYLDGGVLQEQRPGFILADRATAHVPSRKGLVVALDLEEYDYRPGSKTLIRATEGTIVERLPPRIKVREHAPIESPHIMVLIDDPERTVIEPLFDKPLKPVYDFSLMLNGGHIRGWHVCDEADIRHVAESLAALAAPGRFRTRYGVDDQEVMLYAMGDGNHSFATAKAIWERLKLNAEDPAAIMEHPARYALVELVNLHDPGLEFEAIHRVLFGVDSDRLLAEMADYYQARGELFSWRPVDDAAAEADQSGAEGSHRIPFITSDRQGIIEVAHPRFNLVVATLQSFLDEFLGDHPEVRIDYIHGAETVSELGVRERNIGFFLPAISKHELFKTIVLDGALPRKTFSMGEADEKRFYLEARKIVCDS